VITMATRTLDVLRRGGVVTHAALLHEVYGPDYPDNTANRQLLRVTVWRARKMLPPGEYVVNHSGIGYELVRSDATLGLRTTVQRASGWARLRRARGGG
jgi:hypothetical protein